MTRSNSLPVYWYLVLAFGLLTTIGVFFFQNKANEYTLETPKLATQMAKPIAINLNTAAIKNLQGRIVLKDIDLSAAKPYADYKAIKADLDKTASSSGNLKKATSVPEASGSARHL